MSTYNDNLQSIVLATLQNQDTDQKNLAAQDQSAQFTLYFAQGAVITAYEKLETSQTDLNFKASVKLEAVMDTNISNNLLNSATDANQYTAQSISNTAVCAANVQDANIAITRLASDVGSIFSIVSAADLGSAIYNKTEYVYGLINETAYDAEAASQLAMDASADTSEVSSSTVLDNTKSTSALMNNLMKIAASEYDAASKVVAADNATLAAASATEKLAEGARKSIDVDSSSAEDAYNAINYYLNLNLNVTGLPVLLDKVPASKADKSTGSASEDIAITVALSETGDTVVTNQIAPLPKDAVVTKPSSKGFTINIDPIKSPFKVIDTKDKKLKDEYPVIEYDIFVVKDNKKMVFSTASAENLLNQDKKIPCYYKYTQPAPTTPSKTTPPTKAKSEESDTEQNSVKQGPIIGGGSWPIDTQVSIEILSSGNDPIEFPLLDSDGDVIVLGTNYVVFVLAKYDLKYKEKINNFEDFLSAPSQTFVLTKLLLPVPASAIKIARLKHDHKDAKQKQIEQNFKNELQLLLKDDIIMAADLEPDSGAPSDYTYSLEFEMNPPDPGGPVSYRCMFLPYGNVTDIIQNNPKVDKLNSDIATIEKNIQKAQADKNPEEILKAELELDILEIEHATLINEILKGHDPVTPFLFNEMLAEQVNAGNYIPAIPDSIEPVVTPIIVPAIKWIACIGPTTTDNFGNLLMDGELYMPVILTVPKSEDVANYTDALSDNKGLTLFHYKN